MEEVEKTTKEMLEEKIRECIKNLSKLEQGSVEHNALVNDISKLMSSYMELEKTEHAIIDSDRKFAEDIREKDLELHYKDVLERDKMQEQKKAGIRDLIFRGVISVGQVVLNGVIALTVMKLEFLDNGSVCSLAAKELARKAFSSTKTV